MKRIWVYDLETLNIFTATFVDRDSDETRTFIIANYKDERESLFNFLNTEVDGLVGYNCLWFDAQILEFLYRNPKVTALEIRNYAEIITSNDREFPDIPEWRLRIPHLDLYKIHHFDNKNRRVSLKWCEFMMDFENIEDMPSQGEGNNWEEMVLSYNLNDVLATKELYKRSKNEIELRKSLTQRYGLNLINASNSRIGSELCLHLYCKATGKYKRDVKALRTKRDKIKVADILFDYVQFKSEELNNVLNYFKTQIVENTKSGIEVSQSYRGFQFDYGQGGIHGSLHNQVVEADVNTLIIDADVASLYPSIAIVNNLYPEHLGEEFTKVYNDDIVGVRLAEKVKPYEQQDKTIIAGFKEAANSVYGKSNEATSWLYDPKYTMATTINGQLSITMLAEMLMDVPSLQLLQINTDGLTVKIDKAYEKLYYELCNKWMGITRWTLEYAYYSKMIIWDVNNYIAVYTNPNKKPKLKGRWELEDIPYHKNKSYLIIRKAVVNYFTKNIPIEDTIYNSDNIYDFCAGVRAKRTESGMSRFVLRTLKDSLKVKETKLSKTIRYYISTSGEYLYKVYENGREEFVEAPLRINIKRKKNWKVIYFNKYVKKSMKEYDIDYSYYLYHAREWIYKIEIKEQLKMF